MNEQVSESLFDRAIDGMRNAWRDIAVTARLTTPSVRPDLPRTDEALVKQRIAACLDGPGGEVSARARAAELGRLYLGLSAIGRGRFLHLLARDFGVDRKALDRRFEEERQAADDPMQAEDIEEKLREALITPRTRLLSQFSSLPEGFKFLVDMRSELLDRIPGDPTLTGLERDLRRLLTWWFDVGFMTLSRITWDSPASLLEKLVAYEAVHEIRSWTDLKNRLAADRRCYAFIHPRMPSEPLIFIQVALVNGLAGNVNQLLDETAPEGDPTKADTAIFYSITNTQDGLRGISLGNFLIKRVVDHLSHDLPNLRTFSTLSPIPGFRKWLDQRLTEGEPKLLSGPEHEKLRGLVPKKGAKGALKEILDRPDWPADEKAVSALEKPLSRLCARYLLNEKRNGRPLDPVARFHLSNGARVERINWLADISANGLRKSAGMMVNYLYRLRDIEENHEAFAGEGRIIASATVRSLARG
jgi:malonyl-CoA decarboxylase